MNQLLLRSSSWALLLGLLTLLACARQESDPQPSTSSYLVYASYRPLLLTRATLESSVAAVAPQAMHNTGKIYLRGNYVFVNERYEGIHVIDNRDPANPRPVSFLRIPGNVDLAVRGNLLYADNGPDLVTIDISNPAQPQPAGRVRNAFRELPMPEYSPLEEAYQPDKRPANTVVVGWRKLAANEAIPYRVTYRNWGSSFYAATAASAANSAASADAGAGKGGSLARFAIVGQTLYTVDMQSLRVFDLQDPATPVAGKEISLGFGIETIFPQDHYLFLGTQSGMYIYDVATPAAPQRVAFYQHMMSCDPVVVDGRYAYVTLRTGRTCGGGIANVLEVIDLATLSRPTLVRSYPMTNPGGLGAENNRLYVCDDGLKLFDTSKAPVLTQLQHFSTTITDVIPNGDYLLAIGPGGLYQYRVGASSLQPVSLLPISPTL
ncbi:LVIVD repeat-containing protein [Hymenobacter bucti]|uniref:LVIVD repeat-containing protein n=1 Tax=Hymenobacter bucti TaxID=1844114 RepID=A0ABW4QNP1_9BACT